VDNKVKLVVYSVSYIISSSRIIARFGRYIGVERKEILSNEDASINNSKPFQD
jgi:hypothetical protein